MADNSHYCMVLIMDTSTSVIEFGSWTIRRCWDVSNTQLRLKEISGLVVVNADRQNRVVVTVGRAVSESLSRPALYILLSYFYILFFPPSSFRLLIIFAFLFFPPPFFFC